MVGKREAGEQLTTRAYKERQAAAAAAGGGGGGPAPSVATVRVRFPEGVCLQGEFHGSEPTSAVFEWVSGCLRCVGGAWEQQKGQAGRLPGQLADPSDLAMPVGPEGVLPGVG